MGLVQLLGIFWDGSKLDYGCHFWDGGRVLLGLFRDGSKLDLIAKATLMGLDE